MKLDDDIIELDITPNRADALSMYRNSLRKWEQFMIKNHNLI